MTSTDLEKRARKIADKAVSDNYIEDGGYIKDWLYSDLLEALRQIREEALEEAAKIAEAHDSSACEIHFCAPHITRAIRALASGSEKGK
jgi:hypothetical protein